MKTLKVLLLLLVTTFTVFVACDDKENNNQNLEPLTLEEAQTAMENSLKSFTDVLLSLKNGNAMSFLDAFFLNANMLKQVEIDPNWKEVMFAALGEHINGNLIFQESKFPFETFKGKYTYNIGTQTWTKTESNEIILEFPSTPTSTTNDIVLTIASYTDQLVNVSDPNDQEMTPQMYLPTSFNISLNKAGNKLLEFILNSATYVNGGLPLPVTFSADLFVDPVSISLDYNFSTPATNTLAVVVSQDDVEIGFDLTLSTNENLLTILANMENMENTLPSAVFNSIGGEIWIATTENGKNYEFAVDFNIDSELFDSFESETDPTATQINEWIEVELLMNEVSIAHLEAKEDEFGETQMYVVFIDESEQNVELAFADFAAQLDLIFGDNGESMKSAIQGIVNVLK